MKTKLNAFGALSLLLMVGCGAGQVNGGDLTVDQDVGSAKEDSAQHESHPELYQCDTDSDCVAVDKASCCPNGYLVAVNQSQVKAYDAAFACVQPPRFCPLFVVHDTRVAQCDHETHQCQMIDPTQIRCEGFIAPALQHHCPTGYSCKFTTVPDVPGTCVADDDSNQ